MNNIMEPILLGNCVCAGKCFCLATLSIVLLKHIYSTLYNKPFCIETLPSLSYKSQVIEQMV